MNPCNASDNCVVAVAISRLHVGGEKALLGFSEQGIGTLLQAGPASARREARETVTNFPLVITVV